MSSEKPTCLVLKDKVPAGWDVCLLQEVTDFQEGPGILAKDFHESGVPLLRLKNIETPTVRLEGCNFLDPEKVAKKWAHFVLRENDLLISTSASLGRVSVVDPASAGSIAYTGIIRFRSSDPARLDRGYLRAFLSSAAFVEQAEQMATGSVIRHFGPSHLKQMAISLPSLPEQRQIADISDALDDRIALLRETNATLEAMAQALFKSWFVDFDPVHANAGTRAAKLPAELQALFPSTFTDTPQGLVPEGWRMGRIYDVATVTYGAPFASKQFNTEQRGQPLIRIRDLKDEKPGVYTEEVHPKGYLTQPGDIVVGMDGEFRAYLWGGEPAWLNQRVCVFKPKAGYSSAFVNYMIKPQLAAVEATEIATTVIHLGKNDIDRFVALIPSDSVLSAFSEVANPIFSQIVEGKQKAQTLATLRDTLLPRLISGQLRLPDAEALLTEVV